MTQFMQNTVIPPPFQQYQCGLPGWNLYSLAKFGLLWAGYFSFHPLLDLVFAVFPLMSIPCYSLHRLRHWIVLPIGFVLSRHDIWSPDPENVMSQGLQVVGFSTDYLINLITRFISWQMVGVIFVLLVVWLFLSQWVRITVFVVAILLWLNVLTLAGSSFSLWSTGQPTTAVITTGGNTVTTVVVMDGASVVGDMLAQTAPPATTNLNAWLNNFYNTEAKRKSTFPSSLPADAQPFELLVISICSLSWLDIEAAGLVSHPLWSYFDIEFKNFNPTTSYSGLATIRLLRVSCGQTSHTNLYQPIDDDCCLPDNLPKLGPIQHLMMGHNGQFGSFLKEVRENGSMQTELIDQTNLPVILLGFDGSSVYDDTVAFNRWPDVTEKDKNNRSVTFCNTLPLHDGNHYPGASKTTNYKAWAQKFFDGLDVFFTELEESGRKVMVVVMPEHGGTLKGDRMQVSGLCGILNPSVTDVPVGVRPFSMETPHQGAPIVIDQPGNFLVVFDLVVRALDGKIFIKDNVDWKRFTSGLSQAVPASEDSNAVVTQYQDKPYACLNDGDRVPYPQ